MLLRKLTGAALAVVSGAAMIALSTPASAFTLGSPSISQPFAASQIDKAAWDEHHRHRHCDVDRHGHKHCHY